MLTWSSLQFRNYNNFKNSKSCKLNDYKSGANITVSATWLIYIQAVFQDISSFKIFLQTNITTWGTLEEYNAHGRSGAK